VHDGFGLWLCARRLYEGSFIRAGAVNFRHIGASGFSAYRDQGIFGI
jgi:hypothetical protein